jgi:hypothetical protein
LEFPAFDHGGGLGGSAVILRQDRWLVADGPVRPSLVVVSVPSLHFFSRIRKRQEPVRVQAGSQVTATELGAIAIRETLRRAGLSGEDLRTVAMATSSRPATG